MPERFLNAAGMLTDDDPGEFLFGFGRRRCPGKPLDPEYKLFAHTGNPGRHTADASVWSAIVTMLATLDFNLAKDADGNDITFKPTFATALTMYV